ncbi:hypothetical protein E3N88_25886 [Mikania micrantha]|uniref:Uncharacterized protein n=1 Tax=Mikania micrantha TaxID=192012 RepID=A0A5N6N6I5_9ASTR|nr:hypothetical protein E3N88_25886 [Mikania micrantha]
MTRNDDRIREIREIRFKTMKFGLLGSTETHRGTRWAPNWAFAVREARAGEFEFSENHRVVAVRDDPNTHKIFIKPMLIIPVAPSPISLDWKHLMSTLNDLQSPFKPFPSHRRPLEEIEAL